MIKDREYYNNLTKNVQPDMTFVFKHINDAVNSGKYSCIIGDLSDRHVEELKRLNFSLEEMFGSHYDGRYLVRW